MPAVRKLRRQNREEETLLLLLLLLLPEVAVVAEGEVVRLLLLVAMMVGKPLQEMMVEVEGRRLEGRPEKERRELAGLSLWPTPPSAVGVSRVASAASFNGRDQDFDLDPFQFVF